MADQDHQQDKSPRITKVYTRSGDTGQTRLVGGQLLPKHHPRLRAYGMTDELQAWIGWVLDTLAEQRQAQPQADSSVLSLMSEHLLYVQNQIFTVSGDLATRLEDRWEGMPLLSQNDIDFLEKAIDAFNAPLPPLKDFILPGGTPSVTALHICRVVCRRAEREIEELAAVEPIGDCIRAYVNRLSDFFYVLSRRLSHELCQCGVASQEIIWQRQMARPDLPK